jgi:hypothetical protein
LLARMLAPRHLDRWIAAYARDLVQRAITPRYEGTRHLLLAICDHYEPLWGDASGEVGAARVERWVRDYPTAMREFRDADGYSPRHSFFFPGEQYRPDYLDGLGRLVQAGLGEVELHLHHDNDHAENLRRDIDRYLHSYAEHGHLSRDAGGRLRYAFIHGNWCLANSRSDGRYCGVDSELALLYETGCYADFTFPSAPDETQPSLINQIYWPTGDPRHARAHERGKRARVGEVMSDRILMLEGPLAIARRERGLGLRIESAALTARDPATESRLRTWIAQEVQVAGRPEWLFVKLHTHGAIEQQADALLGEPGRAFHRVLNQRYNDGQRYVLHYVTAREMYNIAFAAMRGQVGDPNQYRNFEIPKPPLAS